MTTKTYRITDIITDAEFANIIASDGEYITVLVPEDGDDVEAMTDADYDDMADLLAPTGAEEFGVWGHGVLADMAYTFGL